MSEMLNKKELTKLLHKKYHQTFKEAFKENGFKRYKTNDYIKITEDDIVQKINIQKHSWNTQFTFNITIFPLYFISDIMYYAFGGIRIGMFSVGKDFWWNYSNETEINNALLDSLTLVESKIFPFYNQINDTSSLYNHLNSRENVFGLFNSHQPEIGLMLLKMGEKEKAEKLLKPEWMDAKYNFDTDEMFLDSIIRNNYEQFKIDKKKYKEIQL